ncbi:MAG: DUF814 domain-containing protein [Balneolaceae bacterium]|nr:MAG: DUF814 domain-containing protein [Balneolaceae bacterium]
MNNFFVLIHLTKYLKNKCVGGSFQFSYSPHKDIWECYIDSHSSIYRIIFSTNSSETALFLDKDRPSKKSNVTTFFNSINNNVISNFKLAENDRFITIEFESGEQLLFQVFGNRPNVYHIADGIIKEAFKSNSELEGSKAPQPRVAKAGFDKPDSSVSPKKIITSLDPKFPRHLIEPVTDHYKLHEKSVEEIQPIVKSLTDAMKEKPEFRILEDGNLCLIPSSLLPVENRKTFDNVNDAIRFTYYETSRERRLSSKIQSLKPSIEKAIQKNESTISQLSKADKGLERAEQYEQYGHILMAHAHQSVNPDQEQITLPNFYDGSEAVSIPIKPTISIADNAERYYDKSAKAKRNVVESKRRLKEIQKENRELKALFESLNSIEKIYEFDEWYKENQPDLKKLGILAKTKQAESLPYRQVKVDNYEIWIGKSAKSNDRVTSDAHKEDVWLHARGVSGSHVVIRMNNNKEMPPKSVIRKAAAIAAWNSKARGSNLVPVIVTKRKYITKPKGAAPGAVRVQREDVEMVEPKKSIS